MTRHRSELRQLARDEAAWRRRLEIDAFELAALPPHLAALHREVAERARHRGVQGLVLTGSTVRNQRTEVSDLDYYLVGPEIDLDGLSYEIDLHLASRAKVERSILAGDDFVQWSLRFGWIAVDDGTLREAIRLIVDRRPWPDHERKRRYATKSMQLAAAMVASGDEDAAVVQVRTALSLAARARLLAEGVFPLARLELVDQLEQIGESDVAQALLSSIEGSPSLDELARSVQRGEGLLGATSHATTVARLP